VSAPKVGDRYGLRTLPTYPYPSHHQTFAVGTKAEAEELRRALPNGEHCEVVRLDPESGIAYPVPSMACDCGRRHTDTDDDQETKP
jgi:hypothetical protein